MPKVIIVLELQNSHKQGDKGRTLKNLQRCQVLSISLWHCCQRGRKYIKLITQKESKKDHINSEGVVNKGRKYIRGGEETLKREKEHYQLHSKT